MRKPIIMGLAGLCLAIGVGSYMLAGASVYSQAPAVQRNYDDAQSPFQVERKTGAAVYADLNAPSGDAAPEAETPPAGPKKLLGALLSGGRKCPSRAAMNPVKAGSKKLALSRLPVPQVAVPKDAVPLNNQSAPASPSGPCQQTCCTWGLASARTCSSGRFGHSRRVSCAFP